MADPAHVRAGLPTQPDAGVATLQNTVAGLAAGLPAAGLAAQLTAAVVGAQAAADAGLHAGGAGLATGEGAGAVGTPGLAVLPTQARQSTPFLAH